jgi:hypothetical protein
MCRELRREGPASIEGSERKRDSIDENGWRNPEGSARAERRNSENWLCQQSKEVFSGILSLIYTWKRAVVVLPGSILLEEELFVNEGV